MAEVITFPRPRLRLVCTEFTQADADAVQALLFKTLSACPACAGRGAFEYKHPITGRLDFAPCPCGGTDDDRIDFDFGGAA